MTNLNRIFEEVLREAHSDYKMVNGRVFNRFGENFTDEEIQSGGGNDEEFIQKLANAFGVSPDSLDTVEMFVGIVPDEGPYTLKAYLKALPTAIYCVLENCLELQDSPDEGKIKQFILQNKAFLKKYCQDEVNYNNECGEYD